MAAAELRLIVITMRGAEYVLFQPASGGGEWQFPSDALQAGEAPAAAARRVVEAWTGTREPKLELVDFVTERVPAFAVTLVFRALLLDEPKAGPAARDVKKFPRMGLPERVGAVAGKWVDDALKTSLNYKLTRIDL